MRVPLPELCSAGVAPSSPVAHALRIEGAQLALLAAFGVDDLDSVSWVERQRGGTAASNSISLGAGVEQPQTGFEHPRQIPR